MKKTLRRIEQRVLEQNYFKIQDSSIPINTGRNIVTVEPLERALSSHRVSSANGVHFAESFSERQK
jgi:hypothetical protein